MTGGQSETLASQVERRRSQRLHLAVPVEVAWTGEDGTHISEPAETEILNAHGALLRMKPRLPIAIGIHLTSPRTGSSTQARVVGFCEPTSKGLLGIAVELAAPNQAFWGVSFPLAPGTTPSQWPPKLTENDRACANPRHLTA